MVRLGAKIATVTKDLGNTKALERFDRSGYFLVFVAAAGLFLMSAVLILAGPIQPEEDLLFGIVGWASKGLFQLCITLGLIWQLQRCHSHVKAQMPESQRKLSILAKLRRSQIHYLLFGFGLAVYYVLLASRVILWYWWAVVGLTAFGESMSAFVFEFRNWRGTSSQKSTATQLVGGHGDQQPLHHHVKSSIHDSDFEGSQDRGMPLGLGIVTSKFARKPYRAKMTRVTEASENRTELASTNPLSQIDDTNNKSQHDKFPTFEEY
jgi:hypothetical protein